APSFKRNSIKRVVNMAVFAWNFLRCQAFKKLNKPDVIIGSSPSPLAALAAAIIAKKMQTSFVYEIRDLWPETLITIGGFSRWHPLIIGFNWIEQKLIRQSDKIIAVLPGVVTYLAPKNIPATKVIWIPNFSDLTSKQ